MKRTLLFLLALACTAAMLPLTHARAEEEPVSIQVDTVSGESGGEVDVPVLLDDCVGVDSVQLDLNYDADALSLVFVTFGGLFTASEYNGDEAGRVRVACASALGLKEPGALLTLRFALVSESGSAVTVTSAVVTRVDSDYNQSESLVTVENGGVTLGSAPLPAAKVTPWIPATPTPSPSPTPTPTPNPTPAPTPTTAADAALALAQRIPVAAYIVTGALVLILILLLSLASVKRKQSNG
ncbi:hypothetical protein SDC9_96216 [bioreactor metagenome]|uniref:Cohesin domain-containing protein n=1 Tax=bioreactor metagenome TaxID=1076179 RepID=A0A645A9A1_9ZZZZ|nr:cohesin domain-containing protein [Christensenella sp.]